MSLLEKDTPDVEAGCTVSDLRVALTGRGLDVVDEINIELRPGEVVGLVGESGSGKTTAGTALLATPGAGRSSSAARSCSRARTSSSCRQSSSARSAA